MEQIKLGDMNDMFNRADFRKAFFTMREGRVWQYMVPTVDGTMIVLPLSPSLNIQILNERETANNLAAITNDVNNQITTFKANAEKTKAIIETIMKNNSDLEAVKKNGL